MAAAGGAGEGVEGGVAEDARGPREAARGEQARRAAPRSGDQLGARREWRDWLRQDHAGAPIHPGRCSRVWARCDVQHHLHAAAPHLGDGRRYARRGGAVRAARADGRLLDPPRDEALRADAPPLLHDGRAAAPPPRGQGPRRRLARHRRRGARALAPVRLPAHHPAGGPAPPAGAPRRPHVGDDQRHPLRQVLCHADAAARAVALARADAPHPGLHPPGRGALLGGRPPDDPPPHRARLAVRQARQVLGGGGRRRRRRPRLLRDGRATGTAAAEGRRLARPRASSVADRRGGRARARRRRPATAAASSTTTTCTSRSR